MIPKTKLVIDGFDFGKMTLAQNKMFTTPKDGENIFDRLVQMQEFLTDYSNWSSDEILKMTNNELVALAPELGKAISDSAVPKVSGRRSKIGRGTKRIPRPAG